MPIRTPFEAFVYYHIFNRWLNKQKLFFCKKDYKKFLDYMAWYLRKCKNVEVIAYCVLPNHFHLVIRAVKIGFDVSEFVGKVSAAYARYFSWKYRNPRGTQVFEGRFKSKKIKNESYFHECLWYVNYNAVNHWYVDDVRNWPYSSFREIFLCEEESLVDQIMKNKDLVLGELEY